MDIDALHILLFFIICYLIGIHHNVKNVKNNLYALKEQQSIIIDYLQEILDELRGINR